MTINVNYEPRTLLEAFDEGPLVHTFLRDTFFRNREFPPTNLVEFDFKRGGRKMAPFVAPLVGGKIMERGGYETRYYRAPRVAPIRNLTLADLEPRLPGETIYSGRTAADRAAELLAQDAIFCDTAISRREEWMCREVLINGKFTVTADTGYTALIDYTESSGSAANNHTTVSTKWDAANSDPLADLERARLECIKASGISPNVALFGTNAKEVFIRNAKVLELLDNRRIELATIAPVIQDDAVVRFGSQPGLEYYEYAEYFEDDAGTLYPMLNTNIVLLLSTNVQNKIVYGAYTQLEDAKAKRFVTYQTSRIPFVYGDEEAGNLFYRLTSQPLPMPADILGIRYVEAFSSAGLEGPTKPPYFKPTTAAESKAELSEHTVDELKDIASDEGVDITSDMRKDDIISAIIKNRKHTE